MSEGESVRIFEQRAGGNGKPQQYQVVREEELWRQQKARSVTQKAEDMRQTKEQRG